MSSGCHLCRYRRSDDDVEWQPCHCGRGSGREQPGECAGDRHDGGWRWGAPLGRVAWSRLDPCTGSGTVLIGWGLLPRSSSAAPALKLCFKAWTHRVPPCLKTANQVRPWPQRAASCPPTRVSVGRSNYLFVHFKRICPTQGCTTPIYGICSNKNAEERDAADRWQYALRL
jgi:hypothetical protein